MQKEIKVIDQEKQIMRVTTTDERWYSKPGEDPITGLPAFTFVPSSTWISGYYPKGIAFYKWLADKGWDEAEAIKIAAGGRGSKVHQALEEIEKFGSLSIDSVFLNTATQQPEQLTVSELDCILSFTKWHKEVNPELLATEMTVFGDGYAGTLDRIYRIAGQVYIVDFKTSQSIFEEMKLQISSYSEANIDYTQLKVTKEEWENRKLAILQVGYKLNKNGYKFTEIENKYELFKVAKMIWANENNNARPRQKDYPLIMTINQGATNGYDTGTTQRMVT